MLDSNYLIINRKAQRFSTMRIAGRTALFLDSSGKVLDYGVISLRESIYAVLFCEKVRNITFVIDKGKAADVVTILWCEEEAFREGLEVLKKVTGLHFSPQNKKLNRYAEAVAEKLSMGVKLRITDEVRAADMVKCPECGMLNPEGSMYCLDCGAEIA